MARLLPLGLCLLSMAVSGCSFKSIPDPSLSPRDSQFMALVPNFELEAAYQRYEIDDPTGQAPGTIVIDTKENFLYLVLPNKRAMRYGVATGAEAYGWTGIRIEGPDDLESGIRQMLETPGPVIVDCRVAKLSNCFPMIPSGAAHTDMLLDPNQIAGIMSDEAKALV